MEQLAVAFPGAEIEGDGGFLVGEGNANAVHRVPEAKHSMLNLIGTGGYQSVAVASVGKTQQVDCDGPASINNNFTGKASIGFPAGVVIAATWNTDLAKGFGRSIGEMADEMDVSGWYAPAMNIHRSAFAGRNFEYYSEDGFISGKMAANAILGAAESGVYAFMKHFALNDQETHRTDMLCTWSNEQAMREIYLKPFEISVKEGKCGAVMSAFNYIGNKYAAATTELQNTVLRDEWGFRGMVLTDYFGGYGYQDADILIRNGNDFCLPPPRQPTSPRSRIPPAPPPFWPCARRQRTSSTPPPTAAPMPARIPPERQPGRP